jgi:hypothetical protein
MMRFVPQHILLVLGPRRRGRYARMKLKQPVFNDVTPLGIPIPENDVLQQLKKVSDTRPW